MVYGRARLSNHSIVLSTIYMREMKSQSYWVNVYYGPKWPLTPCRVKHFVHLSGLQHAHNDAKPTVSVDLAVIEVFMSTMSLLYVNDELAAAKDATDLPYPTEDHIVKYVVDKVRAGDITNH